MDDLLIASSDIEHCLSNTVTVLNHLAWCGCKVSQKKAQICQQRVTYLGFQLQEGTRSSLANRKQTICNLDIPKSRRQLQGFLGMAGFCHIWTSNFGLIAKPLYHDLKSADSEPLVWTGDCQKAYETLKLKFMTARALGLPDLQKEFKLYVQGLALGALMQSVGDIPRPVAYLSKQLDTTAASWPPCLRSVAATCDLLK